MRQTAETASDLLTFVQKFFPDSSKTTLRQMLQNGRVRVNGDIEKNARRAVAAGDVVDFLGRAQQELLPEDLNILYEDDDLIVISKDVGLLSVATLGEKEETVQAYLNNYLRAKRIRERIHVVHRLDRDTSGVLVFARTYEIRERLKERFATHDIDRVYIAIVEGKMEKATGMFRSYLREDKDLSVRSVKTPQEGKLAVTHYHTQASGERYSRLQVTLETGRKNQIRAHLSEAGHPVVGDTRYGAKTDPMGRLGLHAQILGFVHPRTGKPMRFEAPVPDAFRKVKL